MPQSTDDVCNMKTKLCFVINRRFKFKLCKKMHEENKFMYTSTTLLDAVLHYTEEGQ